MICQVGLDAGRAASIGKNRFYDGNKRGGVVTKVTSLSRLLLGGFLRSILALFNPAFFSTLLYDRFGIGLNGDVHLSTWLQLNRGSILIF